MKDKILSLLDSDLSDDQVDREIDSLFGIDYVTIEESIEKHTEDSYSQIMLEPEALYTSYRDFYNIYKSLPLKDGDSFIDLGSGVGRSKLLFGLLNPSIDVVAIEFVAERVKAGKDSAERLGHDTEGFVQADLLNYPIPLADYYFIYLPAGKLLERIFLQLKELAVHRKINLLAIESHGDLIHSLITDYPWISNASLNLKTVSERHDEFIYHFESQAPQEVQKYSEQERSWFKSIQSKLEADGRFSFDQLPEMWKHPMIKYFSFFEEYEIIIRDRDLDSDVTYTWLASTFNTRLSISKDHYDSLYPLRTFHREQIVGLYNPSEKFSYWRKLRFKGEEHEDKGQVRKIIFEPEPLVEFSNGERIGPI